MLRASDDAARSRWNRRASLAGAAALVLLGAAILRVRGSTVRKRPWPSAIRLRFSRVQSLLSATYRKSE